MNDLISRAALLQALQKDKESVISYVYAKVNPMDADELEFELEYIINNQPTVDAVPVVHGKWKYSFKEYLATCKNCSYEHYLGTYYQYATNFCPNCGARMDGE